MPPTALLFDLDGTLSNPSEGITRSIAHALTALGRPAPAPGDLERFIGPPLRSTLAQLLETEDRALVEEAVRLYRERYTERGMFENVLYPGIPELLACLRADGARLFVATSKMTFYTERIVEHFGLVHFFSGIYGSDPEGRLDDKRLLLNHILICESLPAEASVMIGDRLHDIVAARVHGIRSIGVTYGFGTRVELVDAGADAIADSPGAIRPLIQTL
ncbi:MAG TPA: HAD hydrolase-like protein [Candidatus Kapabacteria bacterium]|nr:HAD hydrolase-like protein [Candidatus Kapabacteria bacterium]